MTFQPKYSILHQISSFLILNCAAEKGVSGKGKNVSVEALRALACFLTVHARMTNQAVANYNAESKKSKRILLDGSASKGKVPAPKLCSSNIAVATLAIKAGETIVKKNLAERGRHSILICLLPTFIGALREVRLSTICYCNMEEEKSGVSGTNAILSAPQVIPLLRAVDSAVQSVLRETNAVGGNGFSEFSGISEFIREVQNRKGGGGI